MAAVDKIYFNDMDDIVGFLNFVEGNLETLNTIQNGNIKHCIYGIPNKLNFEGYTLNGNNEPYMIANLPTRIGMWLWDNCDIPTVYNRLREQYSGKIEPVYPKVDPTIEVPDFAEYDLPDFGVNKFSDCDETYVMEKVSIRHSKSVQVGYDWKNQFWVSSFDELVEHLKTYARQSHRVFIDFDIVFNNHLYDCVDMMLILQGRKWLVNSFVDYFED